LAVRKVKMDPDWDSGNAQTNQFWERSDQWSFAKRGVPAVFLFTGEHPDYHKPADTPDKIDVKTLAEVAKLAFNFVQVVAEQDAKPARLPVK
jgi:Zn-dependent M28 family amino/carboxypeptidase